MNNNTEVVFDNIEQRILTEIKEAHYSIFVSVAWFTNKKLFNALLEKAKNNCYVSIIIQLDEINSQSGIDYDQIKTGRSECFKISKDAELLHDKFCVIDFQKVITGSYNWTYKASHNSENILILNDPSVATQYISRFEQQKSKFQESSIQQKLPTLSTSHNNIDIPQSTFSVKPDIVETPPNTKQCPHCNEKIKYNDNFCKYCGMQQQDMKIRGIKVGGITRRAVCMNCSRALEENILDAMETKYCTYCGSNNLQWSSCIFNIKQS